MCSGPEWQRRKGGPELKDESQAMRLTYGGIVCAVPSVRALSNSLDRAPHSITVNGAYRAH